MSKNKTNSVDYTQKVLEIKNLRKYFTVGTGKSKLTVPAVDGVTFDVYKREVFGLVGESGCGKTTTGRTIIKLYTPTDGSTKLNGITVGAGYRENKYKIKELKKSQKDRIKYLDPYKRLVVDLDTEYDKKINFLNLDIKQLRKEREDHIKEANADLEDFKKKVYERKSQFVLDIEKINYDFALKKAEIMESTKNPVEREYHNELRIAKNTYNHKVDGIKESAALKKEVIEKRLVELKQEYDQVVKTLKTKFEPLIEQAEDNKVDKSVAKTEVAKLNEQRKADILDVKASFNADKAELVAPDKSKTDNKIKAVKEEFETKIQSKKHEIKSLKLEKKEKISKISKDDKGLKKTEETLLQISQIKEEIKEQIRAEKDQIRSIKETNKSKEALDASRKMQMIFQDPISSLNPRMTVREIIGEGLTILGGYTKEEIDEKVKEALELVGLDSEYMARYPHEFSGGQRQRIGIARALIMDPTFIIADEPISSLDVSIRAQVINLLSELREELGLTVLFIAHDLSVVRFFCDRIAVMYYGKIVELASSKELFDNPMHPYTISLLSAIPQPDPDYEKGRQRINYDPSMHNYREDKPTLREIAKDHLVYVNDKEFKEMKKKYDKNQEKKEK